MSLPRTSSFSVLCILVAAFPQGEEEAVVEVVYHHPKDLLWVFYSLLLDDRELPAMVTENLKKSALTRQQWFTLFAIGSVHFASAICVSLQAPFYPHEAESKNVSATEYGFVFGIYELVSFVSSPILGNYIDVIGAKLLLNAGIVIAAISAIAFGLLALLKTHTWFITLSFVVRIIEALGSSAAVTSAFAITAAVFPQNVATTFATLEIFYGVGYIAGPTIGGFLYTLGGYILPFLVMGSVLLMDGVFVFFTLPNFKRDRLQSKASFKEVFKVPAVLIDAFSVMATSICMGFYSATLEPHIRKFQLSPVSLGLIFVISGATYAMIAPIIGRLCDRKANPKMMILLGTIFITFSVLAVGPAPFFPFDTTFWLVIVGLVLEGIGMALILVSAFIDAIRSAVAGGFPDEITTYGLMSGLWASSFSLGDFIGPSVAGALNDWVGFRNGSLFIILVHIVVFITMATFLIRLRKRKSMICSISALPSVTDNPKEGCVNSTIILEEDYLKCNGTGYGSLDQKPKDSFTRF